MDDLVQWLRAQLDEDERIARKSVEQAAVNLAGADPDPISHWRIAERPATGVFVTVRDQWGRESEVVPTYGGAHAEHIAAHHPARVLRETEAKRRIIALWKAANDDAAGEQRHADSYDMGASGWPMGREDGLSDVLRLLALPFADRTGYQESWRP